MVITMFIVFRVLRDALYTRVVRHEAYDQPQARLDCTTTHALQPEASKAMTVMM